MSTAGPSEQSAPCARGCPSDRGTHTTCSPGSECNAAEAKVTVFAYLTPCFNDCGPYGQCSLLRRHGYLYAGCSCKAGECIFLESFAPFPRGGHVFRWCCLCRGAWGLPWLPGTS